MKVFGRKRVEKRTGAMGAWIGGCDARAGHGNSSVEVELVPQLRLGWLPRGWRVEGRIGRGWPASAKPKARRQPANTAAPHRFWPCGARTTNRLPHPLPLHFTANAMAHWLSVVSVPANTKRPATNYCLQPVPRHSWRAGPREHIQRIPRHHTILRFVLCGYKKSTLKSNPTNKKTNDSNHQPLVCDIALKAEK